MRTGAVGTCGRSDAVRYLGGPALTPNVEVIGSGKPMMCKYVSAVVVRNFVNGC